MNMTMRKPIGEENSHLIVRNMCGINEERGFRLYWAASKHADIICPALGYATSNPFPTREAAIAYAEKYFGERPLWSMVGYDDCRCLPSKKL